MNACSATRPTAGALGDPSGSHGQFGPLLVRYPQLGRAVLITRHLATSLVADPMSVQEIGPTSAFPLCTRFAP
jgi:hypothetical protein